MKSISEPSLKQMNQSEVTFYTIANKDGKYNIEIITNNKRNFREKTQEDHLNRSDFVFETIKLLLMSKITNDEKLAHFLRRIEWIENKILSLEINLQFFKNEMNLDKQRKTILNSSKKLCEDICKELNELQ